MWGLSIPTWKTITSSDILFDLYTAGRLKIGCVVHCIGNGIVWTSSCPTILSVMPIEARLYQSRFADIKDVIFIARIRTEYSIYS